MGEAKQIEYLPNNTVLISINGTLDGLVPLKLDRQSSKVLTVVFDDVTDKDKKFEGKTLKLIDGDTALKILDFIEINKNKNFLIHCAAGISRSAAVALFINRYYGHELKPRFWSVSHPNCYVLGKLTTVKECKY